jgi:hypothetical protein
VEDRRAQMDTKEKAKRSSTDPIPWLEWVFKHWFLTCIGIVALVWVVSGAVTGNWTDDDWNNRDCRDIGDSASGYHETMCWDRDTDELVPNY